MRVKRSKIRKERCAMDEGEAACEELDGGRAKVDDHARADDVLKGEYEARSQRQMLNKNGKFNHLVPSNTSISE